MLKQYIATSEDLGSLDDFAGRFDKYEVSVCIIYQIIRDIFVKQELNEIEIVDGMLEYGRSEYFIKAYSKASKKFRLMVPFHLDAEIDLDWLQKLALECQKDSTELYICLYTAETIM